MTKRLFQYFLSDETWVSDDDGQNLRTHQVDKAQDWFSAWLSLKGDKAQLIW